MCGLVGIFDSRERRPIDERLLSRMNESQIHRGPDAGGLHVEPGVGLAHRRLSIIDLANGKQPLYNEDRSVVIVYNGEIYNFQALERELKARGHVFRTHCDTEVIVHAWEEWGEACVKRLRGMFAFVIWDRNRKILFLARDRLGIKPLYYSFLPTGWFTFASELKALLVHPNLSREIEPKSVEDYFAYGYVPDPRTIFCNTYKLEAGHTLLLRYGYPPAEPCRYWDIPFVSNGVQKFEDVTKGLIEQLDEAVRIRMIADVPLGAFLSGGVDSSAVVSMMAHNSSEPISTCSISFDNPAFDEAVYAQQVAQLYGTCHQVKQVNSDDFNLIESLVSVYDEPYADSSAIPTYRLCELARKYVTVALSGDGGDEVMAGYRRYRWHVYEERIRSVLPRVLRKPMFGLLGRFYPKADWAPKFFRAKSTFEALARDSVEGYFHSVSILGDAMRGRIFSSSFKESLQGYRAIQVLREYADRAPEHPLSRVQYLDMKTYLVGDILTKVDRASMAHSLEVRVPILDHKLVEWMSGIPPAMKLHGREGKYVLKKSMEPYLPADILYRPKKGFAVPLAQWFRGPLHQYVRDSLFGSVLDETGFFDTKYVKRMVEQHQSGIRDHSAPIWSLLMFEIWLRKVLAVDAIGAYQSRERAQA